MDDKAQEGKSLDHFVDLGRDPLLAGRNGGQEADLSHEVRTSLAILTLVSGNLDRLYDRLDDRQRRKMIRDIRRQTGQLNTFLDDVLVLFCEADSLNP